LSSITPLIIRFYCNNVGLKEVIIFLITCSSCVISTIVTIYFFGLNAEEKKYILNLLNKKIA
ncbi:hypothetical protein, partial [Escherichia coli]